MQYAARPLCTRKPFQSPLFVHCAARHLPPRSRSPTVKTENCDSLRAPCCTHQPSAIPFLAVSRGLEDVVRCTTMGPTASGSRGLKSVRLLAGLVAPAPTACMSMVEGVLQARSASCLWIGAKMNTTSPRERRWLRQRTSKQVSKRHRRENTRRLPLSCSCITRCRKHCRHLRCGEVHPATHSTSGAHVVRNHHPAPTPKKI